MKNVSLTDAPLKYWVAALQRRLGNALDSARAPAWVLFIGIAFTLLSTRIAWDVADREARLQTDAAAFRVTTRIVESFAEYESLLRVAGNLIAPSAINSLEGIRGFMLGDILSRQYGAATFLSFVRKIPHAGLPAYERAMRSRLTTDENSIGSMRLQARGTGNHYLLESSVSTSAQHPVAGTDFALDPVMMECMQVAESSQGMVLITSQSADPATSLQPPVLLARVRNPLSAHPDGDALGFLLMGVNLKQIIDPVLTTEPSGRLAVTIALVQKLPQGPARQAAPTPLYSTEPIQPGKAGARQPPDNPATQREFLFGGAQLNITVKSERVKARGINAYLPWLVLLGSASIAALSFLVVRRTQHGLVRAEALARMRGTEVHQSNQRFRDLVESSSDWIWEVDRHYRFTYASPNTHVLLGLAPEELIGRRMNSLAVLGREGRADPVFPFPATSPRAYNSHERQLLRADGTLRTFESSASLVVDERGRFAGLRGIDRDVTEQRRIQMQISELRDKLSENMRANLMEQMLTGLAHELNQPLSAITTYSQACVRLLEMDDPDIGKVSDAMRSTASHALLAADIVKGLRRLTTSRTPHIVRTAVEPLLRNAMTLVDFRIRAAGIDLQLEITPSLPFVWADTVLLTQVCLNLLHNAIDALADSVEKCIRVRVHADSQGNVAIEFLDTGHGIDPKHAEQIFDTRFTTKSEGMGLGLTISRSIMEALNGSLSYAPGPQGGSLFTLNLPFRQMRLS